MKLLKRIKWNHVVMSFMIPTIILLNLFCIMKMIFVFLTANINLGYDAFYILMIESLSLFVIATFKFR